MKTSFSILFVLLALLISVCSFSSCYSKTCYFSSDDWLKDSTYHWAECLEEGCDETSQKQPHTWVQGYGGRYCLVCGAVDDSVSQQIAIGKQAWEQMVASLTFDNVTVKESGVIVPQEEEISAQQDTVIKFSDGAVFIDRIAITEQDTFPMQVLYEGEDASEERSFYQKLFTAVLSDYDGFAYDSKSNVYINTQSVTMTDVVFDLETKIIIENRKVSVDEDGRLQKIVCNMTQIVSTPQGSSTAVVEPITWDFYDYGETVIDEQVAEMETVIIWPDGEDELIVIPPQ